MGLMKKPENKKSDDPFTDPEFEKAVENELKEAMAKADQPPSINELIDTGEFTGHLCTTLQKTLDGANERIGQLEREIKRLNKILQDQYNTRDICKQALRKAN